MAFIIWYCSAPGQKTGSQRKRWMANVKEYNSLDGISNRMASECCQRRGKIAVNVGNDAPTTLVIPGHMMSLM